MTVDPASPITRVFNMCPVDYVADTIVRVCGERWTLQGTEERETERETERDTETHTRHYTEVKAARVFVAHLCATHNVTLETMCGWVRAAGYVLDDVSTELFIRRLEDEVTEETHPLFPLKSFLNTPKKNQLNRVNQLNQGSQTSQRTGRTVNSGGGGGGGSGGGHSGGRRAAAAGGTFSSALSSVFGDVFRGGGEVRRSRREPSTKVREDRREERRERNERRYPP